MQHARFLQQDSSQRYELESPNRKFWMKTTLSHDQAITNSYNNSNIKKSVEETMLVPYNSTCILFLYRSAPEPNSFISLS